MHNETVNDQNPTARFEQLRGSEPTDYTVMAALHAVAGDPLETPDACWARWQHELGAFSVPWFSGAQLREWMENTLTQDVWPDHRLICERRSIEWTHPLAWAERSLEDLDDAEKEVLAKLECLMGQTGDVERFGGNAETVAAARNAIAQMQAKVVAYRQSYAPELEAARKAREAERLDDALGWRVPSRETIEAEPGLITDWQQASPTGIDHTAEVSPPTQVAWRTASIIDLQGEPHLPDWREHLRRRADGRQRATVSIKRWVNTTRVVGPVTPIALHEGRDWVAFAVCNGRAGNKVVMLPLHAVRYFYSKHRDQDVSFALLMGIKGTRAWHCEVRVADCRVGLVALSWRCRDGEGLIQQVQDVHDRVAKADAIRREIRGALHAIAGDQSEEEAS